MGKEYRVHFQRGNGPEVWFEPFANIDDAVLQAMSLLEYGNGWGLAITCDGETVMDQNAVFAAASELEGDE